MVESAGQARVRTADHLDESTDPGGPFEQVLFTSPAAPQRFYVCPPTAGPSKLIYLFNTVIKSLAKINKY